MPSKAPSASTSEASRTCVMVSPARPALFNVDTVSKSSVTLTVSPANAVRSTNTWSNSPSLKFGSPPSGGAPEVLVPVTYALPGVWPVQSSSFRHTANLSKLGSGSPSSL